MISLKHRSVDQVDSFSLALSEFEAEGIPQLAAGTGPDRFGAQVLTNHDLAEGRHLKPGDIPSEEHRRIDEDG